jgi:cytochrome c oxidase subunit 4
MSEKILPRKVYYRVGAALFVLLALTVSIAFLDLGPFNVVVALAIAVTKAVLVVLFFMHVRYASHITWAVVVAGFFWLMIMLVLTMSDFLTRSS